MLLLTITFYHQEESYPKMPPLNRDTKKTDYYSRDASGNNDDGKSNDRSSIKKAMNTVSYSSTATPTSSSPLKTGVDSPLSPSSELTVNEKKEMSEFTYSATDKSNFASPRFMFRMWVLGSTAVTVVTYIAFHSIGLAILAFFLPFTVANLQGASGILYYRFRYGDCPHPKAPIHGIVKCQGRVEDVVVRDNGGSTIDNNASTTTPLRLLVIGDSLAIGVGQAESATPRLPETIAKTLSIAMGGRPVLWTCHGAPGASAGWVVQELKRSFQRGEFSTSKYWHRYSSDDSPSETTVMELPSNGVGPDRTRRGNMSSSSLASSSSDDSSSTELENDEETHTWQERLKQERIQFDPKVVGPFDVAIVMTGSNDVKSAFFPFLLKGEDAELYRQAKERGGSYGNELNRILEVLDQRMRLRLQTLRYQVEAATETIRERLGSFDSSQHTNTNHKNTLTTPTRRRRTSNRPASVSSYQQASDELVGLIPEGRQVMEDSSANGSSSAPSLFPMVVLPGMPARVLPAFKKYPLQWLVTPIVDSMDNHKRRLAERHPGEVMFVEAPTPSQALEYSKRSGIHYQKLHQSDDKVLLNLKDIKRRHARQIEADMKAYYSPQEQELLRMMAPDGVHATDNGYDFWGSHIAHSIVQEWKRKSKL